MTNPNDAVGTNGAFGGRTSVNAFNDVLAVLSSGILSGWACSPNSGMSVVVGGDGSNRDVAIAEDNAGNKTTINNISASPIAVTMPAKSIASTPKFSSCPPMKLPQEQPSEKTAVINAWPFTISETCTFSPA